MGMGIVSKVIYFSTRYRPVNRALNSLGQAINSSLQTLKINNIHWETGLTRDLTALQNNFGQKGRVDLFTGFSQGQEADAAIARLRASKRKRVETAIDRHIVSTIIRHLPYSKKTKRDFCQLLLGIIKRIPFSPHRSLKEALARDIKGLFDNQWCYRCHNIYLEDREYAASIVRLLKQLDQLFALVPVNEDTIEIIRPFILRMFHFTLEAGTNKIEKLIEQTRSLEGEARAICLMYGLECADVEQASVGECRSNDEYYAAVAHNMDNIDLYLRENVLWENLLSLLSQKEIVFDGETYTIKEAQFFTSTWSSSDFVGKNFIFKLIISKDGVEKTLLVKAVGQTTVSKDQIATETFKLLERPTYHVEPHLGFELIEYLPHRLIMFSNQGLGAGSATTIKDFDAFIGDDPVVAQERMRLFGGILAVEYLLGAKDCQMKHIFFADNGGFPFRIDWEFLLDYSDTISGNICPVLKGDEAGFIRRVRMLPDGFQLVEGINQGFIDTLQKAKENKNKILEMMRHHQIDIDKIEADITTRLNSPVSIQDLMG